MPQTVFPSSSLGSAAGVARGAATLSNGDPTSINNVSAFEDQSPLLAFWTVASPEMTNTLMQGAQDFGKSFYKVRTDARALNAPFNLKNGSRIVHLSSGFRGVVRRIDPLGTGEMSGVLNAYVVLEGR